MRLLTLAKTILLFLIAHREVIEAITGAATVTGLLFTGWPKLLIRWRERRRRYRLAKKINAADYTEQDIERAVTFYIDPECQVIDPSGAEDFRHVYPVRQNLFEVVDALLNKQTVNKFSLILGDTGMGKTSFLLNYYARHWQDSHQRERFFYSSSLSAQEMQKAKSRTYPTSLTPFCSWMHWMKTRWRSATANNASVSLWRCRHVFDTF